MTRDGASHPLCLAAVVTLAVNDLVLKAAFPGFVTGKLSDVAWLVAAPVVLAAVLVRLGVPSRAARPASLASVAIAFTALQLWPPLGEAWCALFGGAHVADMGDLITLPAVLLAPLCWRPTVRRRFALPLAALACVATRGPDYTDARYPCDADQAWDPNAALVLDFDGRNAVAVRSGNFASGVWLRTAAGHAVPFVVADARGVAVICPVGGLLPNTDYRWSVDFRNPYPNHALIPTFAESGLRTFRTASASERPPIHTAEDCAAFRVQSLPFDRTEGLCGWEGSDTGWSWDADGDGWSVDDGDCDDDDWNVFPGAPERCNGIDDDCDGRIDEDFTYYADLDQDGVGGDLLDTCTPTPPYVTVGGDCDDLDDNRYPGAVERCDGVDNDCNGVVDDGATATWFPDADGDGWGSDAGVEGGCEPPDGHTDQPGDCDDDDPDVYPGATDLPGDGVDSDCDGHDAPAE